MVPRPLPTDRGSVYSGEMPATSSADGFLVELVKAGRQQCDIDRE